jgi:hypothetical protein
VLARRIGLNYTATAGGWVWRNGTLLGASITPSNANPYAHWAQAASSTFSTSPTFTCVRAQSSSAYGVYTGNGSSAQQVAAFYTTTATNKTNGWLPTTCAAATVNKYVCKGVAAVMFPCPASPPPANPSPSLGSSPCEWD